MSSIKKNFPCKCLEIPFEFWDFVMAVIRNFDQLKTVSSRITSPKWFIMLDWHKPHK